MENGLPEGTPQVLAGIEDRDRPSATVKHGAEPARGQAGGGLRGTQIIDGHPHELGALLQAMNAEDQAGRRRDCAQNQSRRRVAAWARFAPTASASSAFISRVCSKRSTGRAPSRRGAGTIHHKACSQGPKPWLFRILDDWPQPGVRRAVGKQLEPGDQRLSVPWDHDDPARPAPVVHHTQPVPSPTSHEVGQLAGIDGAELLEHRGLELRVAADLVEHRRRRDIDRGAVALDQLGREGQRCSRRFRRYGRCDSCQQHITIVATGALVGCLPSAA